MEAEGSPSERDGSVSRSGLEGSTLRPSRFVGQPSGVSDITAKADIIQPLVLYRLPTKHGRSLLYGLAFSKAPPPCLNSSTRPNKFLQRLDFSQKKAFPVDSRKKR